MKNFNKKLMLISLIISNLSFSLIGRDDMKWEEYEDFALGIGRYVPGRDGIIVYKKDGTRAGVLNLPMPDLKATVYGSMNGAALVGDAQAMVTVGHTGAGATETNFIGRYQRTDVELSKGFKALGTAKGHLEFRKQYSELYTFNDEWTVKDGTNPRNGDTQIFRFRETVWDNTPYTMMTDPDFKEKVKDGTVLIRVSSGDPVIAVDFRKTIPFPREEMVGGEVRVKWIEYDRIVNGQKKYFEYPTIFKWRFNKNFDETLPLSTGTSPGDSGSPLFYYNKEEKKWYYVGHNSAITSAGYDQDVYGVRNYDLVQQSINEKNEEATNVNAIKVGSGRKGFKNQIYNSEANISLSSNIDTQDARLIFNDNGTINANNYELKTAGIEVDENKELTYNASIGENNIVRKIGKGTLVLNEVTNENVAIENLGNLHIGDGTVELNARVKTIKLGSGRATIKIGKDGVLDNNIYFGIDGGKVDLNGHNISVDDIRHIDKGAIFTNQNTETKSKLTFEADGDRVYLGKFEGNLDVDYNSSNNWELRGDSNFKDLNINKGTIKVVGDSVLYSYALTPLENRYKEAHLTSENINIKEGANLELNRGAKVNSNINIDGDFKINGLGEVLVDLPKQFESQPENYEKDLNKIEVSGNINFKNTEQSPKDFNINLENNNTALISANISGNINLIKDGTGEAELTGNNTYTGNATINNGALRIGNANSINNLNYNIKNSSILELKGITNLDSTLEKIDKSSNGILSIDTNLDTLSNKLDEYQNIYIGTKSEITIGQKGQKLLENLSSLRLGGDNGTIRVFGLENNDTKKTLKIGNGIARGKVIIDELTDNSKLDIETLAGVDLEVINNRATSKLIDLTYGSMANYSTKDLIKETSEGVLLISSQEENNKAIELNYQNLFVGAKKGTVLSLDNPYSKLSGDGTIKISNIASDELLLDGQGFEGGLIEITSNIAGTNKNITVQGNKNENSTGNITLKLNKNDNLNSANITLKNNGILSLEKENDIDTVYNLNITDDKSTVIEAENIKLKLKNTENAILGSEVKGRFDIEFNGTGEFSLTNEKNKFFGDLLINDGIYKNDVENLTDESTIYLNSNESKNGKLETSKNIKSKIILNGDEKENQELVDIKFTNEEAINLERIDINRNLHSKGTASALDFYYDVDSNKNIRKIAVNYADLKNNGKDLLFENQLFSLNRIENISGKGNLKLKDAIVFIHGRANANLLVKEKFDSITLDNSIIDIRDYLINGGTAQKIDVNGNSAITINKSGNGGCGTSQFYNEIQLADGSELAIQNGNWSYACGALNLGSKITGSGNLRFRILKGADNSLMRIKADLSEFTGKIINERKKGDKYKELGFAYDNDAVVTAEIVSEVGNANIGLANEVNHLLTLTNVNNYHGEITAREGSIKLQGSKALKTDAQIYATKGFKVLFDTNGEDVETNLLNYGTFDANDDNDGFHKIGEGSLIFKDKLVTDRQKIYVEGGKVVFDTNREIKTKNNKLIEFNVSNDSAVRIESKTPFTNIVLGEGNLEFVGNDNYKELNHSQIKNTGKLIIENKVKFLSDSISELNNVLEGTNDSEFKFENMELTTNKDIANFLGILNIGENSKLKINSYSKDSLNRLTGTGTVINNSGKRISLSNEENYLGKVIAENGDFEIVGNKLFEDYLANGGNIVYNMDSNYDLTGKKISTDENSKIIKKDTNTMDINKANLENIQKLELIKGITNLNENAVEISSLENENKLNDIDIKENAILNIKTDLNLTNLSNLGIINLEENNLETTKYNDENKGVINLSLFRKTNEYRIKTDNDTNIRVNVELNDEIKNDIKKNGVLISNNPINILNKDELEENSNYIINVKNEGNRYLLISELKNKNLGLLHMLSESNIATNNEINYNMFENKFGADFIYSMKKDMNYKEYKTLENTKYKNSTNMLGFDLYLSKNQNIKNDFDINPVLTFKYINIETKSDVLNQNIVDNKAKHLGVKGILGIRKGIFKTKLGIGIDDTIMEFNKNNYHLILLNTNFSLAIDKEFDISNNMKFSVVNETEIKYQPLIFENIKNSEEGLTKIVKETPVIFTNKMGMILKTNIVDLETSLKFGYDFSKYGFYKNDEILKDEMKDNLKIEGNIQLIGHISKKLNLNLDLGLNNEKKEINLNTKLGISYNW